MFGYQGKILRVDLSSKTCKVEALDLDMAKKYIGGRGSNKDFLVKYLLLWML